ncbi:MAG: undecaprenyl-diphosphate phosphatase [Burkholderiaceae bacterium]
MFELLVALPILVKAVILGIVEGLTEFLPISSTGHLILAGSLLGYHDASAKVFDVAIQTGAMFAVIVHFRRRIAATLSGLFSDPVAQRFAINVCIAFIPAAVLGVMFASKIKSYLFAPVPVAIALIVGGIVIMVVENYNRHHARPPRVTTVDQMTWVDALKVGFAQAFALIPGTSRSGATIIGGMLFGLSRITATEFSFYLAIPTLIGAGVYDTFKYRDLLSMDDLPVFAVGTIVAFFCAWACVAWLIRYVASRDFMPFAWYRIVFGLIVLATAWTGVVDWAD